MAEAGGNLSLDAPIGGGGQAAEYSFSVHGWVLRVLVMNRELADRSWVLSDGGKRSIVCGPRYAGTLRVRSGRYYLNTEIESGRTGGFPVRIYTGSAVRTLKPLKESERMPAGNTGRRLSMSLSLGHWERKDGVSPAMPGFDDRRWTYSGIPLQMGADGDGTADAWYRTNVEIDTPGEYTLLVEGSDRAMAFSDGQRTVPFAIKNGEIPFVFTKGRHLLAVFTAHDGRDKLPAYTGPIDSADRKGLFGKALLVKGGPSIRSLDDWQVLKATAADDVKSGPPSPEVAGWQPYTIGQDAFAGKQGFGWFRMRLPDPPAGATQTVVHFASVDENATVFAGNRLLLRHAGWNAPFSVLIDRVDTFSRPIWLTVFVENYSNEGGIDKPVRAGALLAPVAVTGWRMRGGTGETTDSVRWSTVASKVGPEGPCWWRTTFLLPVLTQPGIVWRVITTGLGHGSIWINGHNLGRYPEKIPINGLYIPECWMKAGINSVQIYDEDGNDARQVSIEAEPGASRWVTTLSAPL
jgi:beta-galactosidase